jgi:acetyl-CoA carboxylase biotin carboxyl carrier protein
MEKKANGKIQADVLNEALKIMEKGHLVELLYEQGDLKIQLKKAGAMQAAASVPQYMPAAPEAVPAQAAAEAKKPVDDAKTGIIKSPMVGTFYKASSPEAAPFVKIGDMVEPGKTVCIIEAMKIMNEIKSEVKGRVKEVLVENAQAVEFNQPLIIVEKT